MNFIQTKAPQKEHAVIVGEKMYPVKIGYFRKKNSSARIRDGIIHLRISSLLSQRQKSVHIDSLLEKITKKIIHQPESWNPLSHLFKKPFLQKPIGDCDVFVGNLELNNEITYSVYFRKQNRKSIGGSILPHNRIIIKIPSFKEIAHLRSNIEKVIYRLLSQDQIAFITDFISTLNEEFFGEHINEIKLKNTQTRWGSCSRNKNINLSVKLLFVPINLLEYVVIHELAHLKEMNHSVRFWKHVEQALPDYKERKKILRSFH